MITYLIRQLLLQNLKKKNKKQKNQFDPLIEQISRWFGGFNFFFVFFFVLGIRTKFIFDLSPTKCREADMASTKII